MKQSPDSLGLASVDELSGHVWVQELPTGGEFRFQVAPSGLVTFGVADRRFDSVDSVPVQYRRAAQEINDQIDRAALDAATDDPSAVTFCGVAIWNEGIPYEWETTPAFVGSDVWTRPKETFLSPDVATAVFERLGLSALPAVKKELPVGHADFTRFEDDAAFPASAWWRGAAAGVLIRDKSGGRVTAWRSASRETHTEPERWTATELADAYATVERIEQTMQTLRDNGEPVTVSSVRDRLVTDVAREVYAELFSGGEFIASVTAFESAVAERVQQHQFTTE